MFEYFYHEILRKTIIAFGTLFNGIEIKHTNSSDDVTEVIKVPLAYGPTQKFLARLEQSAELSKSTQISLPRMSFEFVGLQYDSSRKVTTTQTFVTTDTDNKTEVKKAYMPVPYNMAFELTVYTKLNDDMLQIVEQILPYFQPAYNLSVNLVESIGEKRDIPVVIESITMQDDYEGDFTTRRSLYYTIRFTAKTYLFGPVTSASKDLIKKVRIGYVEGGDTKTPTRDVTYSVVPRAVKNYTGDTITTLAQDVGATAKYLEVADTSGISDASYIVIDNEQMYILEIISGTKLKVERGTDNTTKASHVSGTGIGLITAADNALIEVGDDFGFDGEVF
tara:strand:- start:810 stop:1814 length:1005 start_codon:yes stop_codon:yes gene_type:complete